MNKFMNATASLILLSFTVSAPSFASTRMEEALLYNKSLICSSEISAADAKLVYEAAVEVPEKDGRKIRDGVPALGADLRVKEIAYLICTKKTRIAPGAKPKYKCECAQ